MGTSFNKKLAAAKKVPRPYKDVTVALRADVAEKRDGLAKRRQELEDRFAKAQAAAIEDQRLTSSGPEEDFTDEFLKLAEDEQALDREEADALVTLRFEELPGDEWAELTVKHPARPGVLADMPYGYNIHAAAMEAAQVNGRVVEDGKFLQISAQQWDDLWEQLPGRSFGAVCDVIYFLNEYEPEQRVNRLGKASRPLPADSPDSPE